LTHRLRRKLSDVVDFSLSSDTNYSDEPCGCIQDPAEKICAVSGYDELARTWRFDCENTSKQCGLRRVKERIRLVY
jgi:hypothetical protein